ncbi:MAG: hypothetical protein DCC69_03050 [Hyphomicrobiales bacterium]|nr:MAG: hypothetical protein DCC69_03050 [Hyphomicrobiales bacterium]
MFKRTILAAVAVSMFAVPMAQAQSRYDGPRSGHHYTQPQKPGHHATKRHAAKKPAPQRHHAQRPAPTRHHWAKGHRVPDWQRRQHVRDYHRHGLRKPSRGQQWVRVDNDYLLISLATGVILGMAAAR